MSKEICDLYQLEGVDVDSLSVEGDKVVVYGRLHNERESCPKCRGDHVIFSGKNAREFHLPSTGSKNAVLRVTTRRNQCKNCNKAWWPQVKFANGKQRMSKSFVQYILDLLEFATIKEVADYLEVTWDTVKNLHKTHLEKRYSNIELKDVKYISIDEISIAKGHKYMTVVADLKTGRILHSVEGRKKQEIRGFLKILKKKPCV